MGILSRPKKYWKPHQVKEKLRKIPSLDWEERKSIERNLESAGDLISKKELREVLKDLHQSQTLEERDKKKLKKTFGLSWWR